MDDTGEYAWELFQSTKLTYIDAIIRFFNWVYNNLDTTDTNIKWYNEIDSLVVHVTNTRDPEDYSYILRCDEV